MYQVLLGEINILVKSNYTIYGYLLIYWRFFFFFFFTLIYVKNKDKDVHKGFFIVILSYIFPIDFISSFTFALNIGSHITLL